MKKAESYKIIRRLEQEIKSNKDPRIVLSNLLQYGGLTKIESDIIALDWGIGTLHKDYLDRYNKISKGEILFTVALVESQCC